MAVPKTDLSSGEYDTVVVGAGIAGLMASRYLTEVGYRVIVFRQG